MNATHQPYPQRLQTLQTWMRQQALDWLWIPAADAHLNEYLPQAAKRRDWVCGFTGSAGDLLVGQTTSWLFVDSRYHEQADQEVPLERVNVAKLGLPGVTTLASFLQEQAASLPDDQTLVLAVDPWTVSASQLDSVTSTLQDSRYSLTRLATNPVDALRPTEPDPPQPIYALSDRITGESPASKLTRLRTAMAETGVTLTPVSKLDEIAWLTNLRGRDIAYNPVFTAFALVGLTEAHLFCHVEQLKQADQESLKQAGWQVLAYADFLSNLPHLAAGHRISWSPAHHSDGLKQALSALDQTLLIEQPCWIARAKSLKNPRELAGMRAANIVASQAIIRTLARIDQWAAQQQPMTEAGIADALEALYRDEGGAGFVSLSFNTIAGSGANSSIVHYGTPDATRPIEAGDWVLLDSGIQWMGEELAGTTDCTRTTVWGDAPTARQKWVYTLVLKGHIAASRLVVPAGTPGHALDAVCRQPMWQAGLDYGHGTGHGVGALLNVHEGPNGIHRRAMEPLQTGQINSIEPGYYEPGWGGVRLENLVEVVEATQHPGQAGSGHRQWLASVPLAWVPFEAKLVDWSLLSEAEKQWLKDYHAEILARVGPAMAGHTIAEPWLYRVCEEFIAQGGVGS